MNINTSDIPIIIPMRKTKVFYEIIRNDNLTCYVKKVELRFKMKTKKIGAFPSDQPLLRLIVTIMMDINEEWITERKYMILEVD